MHGYKNTTKASLHKAFLRVAAGVLAVAVVGFAPSFAHAAGLEIKDIRVGQNTPVSRVVVELNKETTPKMFTLTSPPRLVMDFPTLESKQKLSAVDIPPGSLVKSVRGGPFNSRTHRLVIDLNSAMTYSTFTIPAGGGSGFRFVVDMKPAAGSNHVISRLTTSNAPAKDTSPITTSLASKKPAPSKPVKPALAHKDSFVVYVDPGHGGIDPGAIGKQKTREKDVVLGIGRRVRDALNKKPGIKAVLTRDSDVFLKLQERVNLAKKHHADLFISLHADAHNDRRVRGATVYVLSETASDREAERLARLANRGVAALEALEDSAADTDVRDILIDLAQRDTMNSSALLARELITGLDQSIYMRSKDIKFAGFRVLKAPDIPSVLVEMGYISNPTEEKKLRTSAYQQQIADSIAGGIASFIRSQQE